MAPRTAFSIAAYVASMESAITAYDAEVSRHAAAAERHRASAQTAVARHNEAAAAAEARAEAVRQRRARVAELLDHARAQMTPDAGEEVDEVEGFEGVEPSAAAPRARRADHAAVYRFLGGVDGTDPLDIKTIGAALREEGTAISDRQVGRSLNYLRKLGAIQRGEGARAGYWHDETQDSGAFKLDGASVSSVAAKKPESAEAVA